MMVRAMGASPSVRFHIDIENYDAWAQNELFPEQRVELDKETIQDCKHIMGMPAEEVAMEQLRKLYRDKFSSE